MANEPVNKAKQKFFELIKPNHNFEFVGRMNLLLGISVFLVSLSILMLPITHFWRGHTLNYSIDFLGVSELQAAFTKPEDATAVRKAMEAGGVQDPDTV